MTQRQDLQEIVGALERAIQKLEQVRDSRAVLAVETAIVALRDICSDLVDLSAKEGGQ